MLIHSTVENAVIEAMRFAKATANGVRWVIKRSGMTGYGAHRASTYRNAALKMRLTASNPDISGCDQGSSSVVLILNADNKLATKITKVKEPRKSMRLSFENVPSFATASGNLMLTLSATRAKEMSSNGVFAVGQRLARGWSGKHDHLQEEGCAPSLKVSKARDGDC